MISSRDQLISDLWIFHIVVLTLLTVGLLFVYSSSSVYALTLHNDAHYFLKKQIVGLFLGGIGFYAVRIFSVSSIKRGAYFFLGFATIITACTLLPSFARHINGSSRWLFLGRFSFQPSELLKIGVVLTLARLFGQPTKMISRAAYILIICVFMIISGILLKQPDFGLTMTLWTVALFLFFIAHGQVLYLMGIVLSCIPFVAYMIIRYPYRLQRVLTFLNPWNDAKGTGFQIIQSLVAIGSGGIFGIGIAQSKQKLFYLPMQHTDFIFSIIAEETGLIGSTLIILLLITFFYIGFKIAHQLHDIFSYLATCGFTLLITLQAAINIAVCTGLVPTKGIGLPFISYGNSALIVNCVMIGLITHFVHENQKIY